MAIPPGPLWAGFLFGRPTQTRSPPCALGMRPSRKRSASRAGPPAPQHWGRAGHRGRGCYLVIWMIRSIPSWEWLRPSWVSMKHTST